MLIPYTNSSTPIAMTIYFAFIGKKGKNIRTSGMLGKIIPNASSTPYTAPDAPTVGISILDFTSLLAKSIASLAYEGFEGSAAHALIKSYSCGEDFGIFPLRKPAKTSGDGVLVRAATSLRSDDISMWVTRVCNAAAPRPVKR